MTERVLVAYATRSGSTREVAEAVAATLRERGLAADVQPAGEVRAPEGYGAVVVGAPLYAGQWQRQARRFLVRHRDALERLPVAVFALGPMQDKEEQFTSARDQLDGALAKIAWLAPVDIAMFGGKFDPAAMTFPFNLIPAMKAAPASDIRDWDAIRAWAGALADRFGGETTA